MTLCRVLLQPSFLLKPLTPTDASLVIYVVVEQGRHLAARLSRLHCILCSSKRRQYEEESTCLAAQMTSETSEMKLHTTPNMDVSHRGSE